jgi:ABC-type protease/lipase transport system fused ATPase/permease subunit
MPLFLIPIYTFLKPYLLQIALFGAAIVTVLLVLARVKRAGVLQERTETAIAAGQNIQRQSEARAKAPRSQKEVADAMRKGKF